MSDHSRVLVNDRWRLKADPHDRGVDERWFERAPDSSWIDGRTGEAAQKTLGVEFTGIAWYARRLDPAPEWDAGERPGGRVFVRFDSVATDITVWVNGEEIGRASGDYLAREFEIPGRVTSGSGGWLVARVDQVHAPRPAPGVLTENGHITKGFHDVLSLQHAGLWGDVSRRATGPGAFAPGGVRVTSMPCGNGDYTLRVRVDLHPGEGGTLRATCEGLGLDARTRAIPGQTAELTAGIPRPAPWSPDRPRLFPICVTLETPAGESDRVRVNHGFRSIRAERARPARILLNDAPVLLRGVLHWGHEPGAIAPSPARDQVRDEFARLRERGFNLVCLCMWYAPEWYYELADETGMLLWQEHPVWKSRMGPELAAEYEPLFRGFAARDAGHASVVIVSGTCEHERFDPDTAERWLSIARLELPDRLLQLNTAFLAWVRAEDTDLYDEHVYDSHSRWISFVDDVGAAIGRLPPKPFVMGETIIGTSWPDIGAIRSAIGGQRPWWLTRGVDECARFEAGVLGTYGAAQLDRFRALAERQHLGVRKFQCEVLRASTVGAGWVMNHIRDVPACRCGFKDDLDRWRFTPEQLRAFLADGVVLLRTPGHARTVHDDEDLHAEIGVSNFGPSDFDGEVEVRTRCSGTERTQRVPITCPRGGVVFSPVTLPVRADDPRESPTPVRVDCAAPGLEPNSWTLWRLPRPSADGRPGVVRMEGIPYGDDERRPSFEELGYSSGWGLRCESWKPLLPDLDDIAFRTPLWRSGAPMPHGARAVIATRVTHPLVDFISRGGRGVLLANPSRGGLAPAFINLWGQSPLIPIQPEPWPVNSEDGALWLADALQPDLTRRSVRAVEVERLNIAQRVDPVVRHVFTHDTGAPRLLDGAFATRVGTGLLVVSAFDHSTLAGRALLDLLLRFALDDRAGVRAACELDPDWLRRSAAWEVCRRSAGVAPHP